MATRFLLAALLLLVAGCSLAPGAPLEAPSLTGDARVTLLQTTDIHHAADGVGHLGAGGPGPLGAYARIAAYVESVRAASDHPVLLVDSGDWSMGSCYDLTLGQQPLALLFMDALRYDCATLGNHEFDYGPGGLARILASAQSSFAFRTPLVASNIQAAGSADLSPWVGPGRRIPPTRVQTLANGLRVGYLGLMGRDAAGATPMAAPVAFKDFSLDYGAVQALVDGLRETQGCRLVIALSHSGTDPTGASGEDVELARHVRGIDVIASGHTHTPLPGALRVANGPWGTLILNAGAFGTGVARLELAYHGDTGALALLSSENHAMTDAGAPPSRDPAFLFMVGQADLRLNAALGKVFTGVAGFGDYDPLEVSKGLYHPVGWAEQDLRGSGQEGPPRPSGLGNLCADAERAVPNLLIQRALPGLGWTGSPGDPAVPALRGRLEAEGFDANPFEASIVATGVVRGFLAEGPLSFADLYDILPLGATPDPGQALPAGYPLLSAYLTVEDLQKLCAFQLLGQTGLISREFYLNISGLGYTLQPGALEAFFRWATAAGILELTQRKSEGGSADAAAALGALGALGADGGAALLGSLQAGNAYAAALVALDDEVLRASRKSPAAGVHDPRVALNLGVLGQVAAAKGASALNALLLAKALEAVGELSGFAPSDPACAGTAVPLDRTRRHRLSASLYSLLMMGEVRDRFGADITAYAGAAGPGVLTKGDLPGILASRVNLGPPGAPLSELKEWMALLLYLTTPQALGGHFPSGRIGAEYGDGAGPGGLRSASYPSERISRLVNTLERLGGSLD